MGYSLRGTWNFIKAIFEWRSQRTGWVTSNVSETQGFVSTQGNQDHPDIQLALCTVIVDDHARKLHWGHGYTLHVTLMRPKSRGTLTLASRNPMDKPLIDPAFFKHPDDINTLIAGTQLGLDIMNSEALKPYRGNMIHPVDRNQVETHTHLSCAITQTPNTTLWALAKWVLHRTHWRWSMPNFKFTVFKICGSLMLPSCPIWSQATPTHPPS